MSQRVAITGVGAVSALGAGAAPSFARLTRGETGLAPGPQALGPFSLEAALVGAAGTLEFSAAGGRGSESEFGRTEALTLSAIQEVISASGLSVAQLAEGACGLVWGTTTSGLLEAEAALVEMAGGDTTPELLARLRGFPVSAPTLRASQHFGCFEHLRSVCSACSSGAVAVALGAMWIRAGVCERVIVGGADALCATTRLGFGALGLLDPAGCRPFDPRRTGLCLGEGAAALMLEAETVARRRGADVCAWLDGWAVGAEAFHITQPEPRGETQSRLIGRAIQRAGATATQIGYVAAHGTGTPRNDETELRALERIFGEGFTTPRVSSHKAQLGHTLGAAGALSAVFSVLALKQGCLPPNPLSQQASHPGLIGAEAERLNVRFALVNAFGFGGMDAVLCLAAADQADAAAREKDQPRPAYIVRSTLLRAADDEEPARLPLRTALLAADRSRRFDDLSVLVTASADSCVHGLELDAGSEVALLHGINFGLVDKAATWLRRAADHGPRRVPPAEFPLLLPSAASGNASVYLGLRGMVFGVSRRGASAHAALHAALDLVGAGETQHAISCAVEPLDRLAIELGSGLFAMPPPSAWLSAAQLVAGEPLADAAVSCRVVTWGESAGRLPPPPQGTGRAVLGSDDGSVALDLGEWGEAAPVDAAFASVEGVGGCGAAACFDAILSGGEAAALLVDVVLGRALYTLFVREAAG